MVNAFNEIIQCEEDFASILDKYNFLRIFEPVIIEYQHRDIYQKIIKYIGFAFSNESNKITVEGDRRKETEAIFKQLQIDEKLYNDVVLLQNASVLKSVKDWLSYQDNSQFEFLLTLKEAYVQQQTASVSPLKKSDGISIDFDQKQKCIEHMLELRKMIRDAESELKQNDPKLKQAYKDVSNVIVRSKKTLGVETMLNENGK